ncbi:MAG TPA: presqualene diphosphate synthase HpnD [Rhizomicrobium sp.]|jgi:phytoene synthase|nr:presqualene diphosphate synthase HpnD [Rhizomicrobium sp.]
MTNAENIGAPAANAVKKKASTSSFYIAMRLMPAEERDAMFAIYAFCRKVDDIADDGVGTRAERHERLEQWRSELRALYARSASPPPIPQHVRFLAPAVARYGLRLQDFLSILDGMDMDVAEDIVAPDLATLDLYCDRVASAVGRLSIKVFGMEEGPGFELAHHLGRALQLTNILRDIDEDAAIGRLYLPREYLEEMDCCRQMDPSAIIARPQIDAVCRRVAKLAHHHYDAAGRVLASKPKGRIKTPRLMGAVYSDILSATEAQGFAPPRHRVSLPKSRLLSLVLRQGLFS